MNFLTFDETRDFPFYDGNPKLTTMQWFILILMIPISVIAMGIFGFINEFLGSVAFCLVLLVPLLYFSNWNYKLFFHKPTKNEIILAVLMFIGYMIYSMIIGYVLNAYHLTGTVGIEEVMQIDVVSLISLIFSMMGEELLKFIPMMLFMRVVYKYTGNSNLAIFVSSVIVLIGFGLIHYAPPTNTIASVLALQGFGTIFELYGYLRTKNLLVPYISHFLTDLLVFIVIILGL